MNTSIDRRRFLCDSILVGASPWPLLIGENRATNAAQSPASSLTVGVVQQAREPQLGPNRDKIVHFIGEAKAHGCRLAIFPEDALGSPVGTSNEDLEQAVDVIREAARS